MQQHQQTKSGIKEMQSREYLQSRISLTEGRCTGIHLYENSPVELGIQLGAQ